MRISEEKKQKISEQILGLLFRQFPKTLFTSQIAREIARDEEFVKKLLFSLRKSGFIIAIKKNQKGTPFSRRIRWRLSNKAYQAYKQHQ
jgi:predicted transcriptional regulator with HTH domain